ncbi:UDP-N-acetylmuramoyl-L-alanyl-D-glutamate--2,6-diaminopimelate ligase [Longirhabdus pacifica]|uniref:UDP-N-acetylmuramoyl-L-alanyl-D-glutamate--2, 6-diaminopimelate ligase n=1 Tax=Longirhabdus pacifica TaxID=2305227 RepID=UPI0010091799|nr:UDP-N-acetylmuramoyl-L-alanyl-D-glutamate--2,6-diaminopimelate ligase [Longirhabdus pacifica]
MELNQLHEYIVTSKLRGPSVQFTGIQHDSRKIQKGDLFICIRGNQVDGHHFAATAINKGAAAIVVDHELDINIPQLIVRDTTIAMAIIANLYYGFPSHEMKVIGVTGTNGKTTITTLMEHVLREKGFETGLMGTINMKIGNAYHEVKNTTQESLAIQKNFREMRHLDTQYCIMEVSSHALTFGRVNGIKFRTAIFTNLTQDHLDFHRSMEEYRDAKSLLFSRLGNTFEQDDAKQFAVLNADDPASAHMAKVTSAQIVTYGIDQHADVRATNIHVTGKETTFHMQSFAGDMDLNIKMLGKFSVYNVLAVITACLLEGIKLGDIKEVLEKIDGVNGRFEMIDEDQDFSVIVDYSHTPDSLENALKTVSQFVKGKTYCVFGCGGDRDRTKRAIMGKVAAKYSDVIFVTSDNPRSEDPDLILQDIEEGLNEVQFPSQNYELIVDRRAAIEKAIEKAGKNDVILIAGKGHETYQEIKGVRNDFDDKLVAREALRSLLNK